MRSECTLDSSDSESEPEVNWSDLFFSNGEDSNQSHISVDSNGKKDYYATIESNEVYVDPRLGMTSNVKKAVDKPRSKKLAEKHGVNKPLEKVEVNSLTSLVYSIEAPKKRKKICMSKSKGTTRK